MRTSGDPSNPVRIAFIRSCTSLEGVIVPVALAIRPLGLGKAGVMCTVSQVT
ncbi:hypothetical protein ILFOPFJJ_07039 [Ensifer psoraleae]|nr:hypothetical protein [Sinorhizobium psoraleae]